MSSTFSDPLNTTDLNPFGAFALALAGSSMIVATLLGNSLVCLAVCLVRKLKQPANYLLVSLAVSDFFVGMFVMPPALLTLLEERWMLGHLACSLWTTADLTLCTASILNLCLISVDRYLVISRPLRYAAQRTRRRMLMYIAIVWAVALIVSVSPLIVVPTPTVDVTCQVTQNPIYQIYATIISFYGPTIIMVIVYANIWRVAHRLSRADRLSSATVVIPPEQSPERHLTADVNGASTTGGAENGQLPPKRSSHRLSSIFHAVRGPLISTPKPEKGESKARKTLGVIMSVYLICWFPFFILALLKSNGILLVPRWLDHFVLWLGYSNSMLNPAIYCKYNKDFRIPFREMLCCRFRTLQAVMRNESFNNKYGPIRTSIPRGSVRSMDSATNV